MRFLSICLSLLLLAMAQPALADITARYAAPRKLGPDLVIQVDANGDARVEAGGRLAAIRRAGIVYLVREDRNGRFVLRLDDFTRIEARRDSSDLRVPEGVGDLEGLKMVEGKTETIAGRRGIQLLMQLDGEVDESSVLAVVSDDPDLRPVGEMIAAMFGGPLAGPPALQAAAEWNRQVFARGAVLRFGSILELQSTSSEDVPASAFDLPGPVLSGEAAQARLGPAW